MSWSLRSRNTSRPRSRPSATACGPSRTKSSRPILSTPIDEATARAAARASSSVWKSSGKTRRRRASSRAEPPRLVLCLTRLGDRDMRATALRSEAAAERIAGAAIAGRLGPAGGGGATGAPAGVHLPLLLLLVLELLLQGEA